jgi:hypothetical protein
MQCKLPACDFRTDFLPDHDEIGWD